MQYGDFCVVFCGIYVENNVCIVDKQHFCDIYRVNCNNTINPLIIWHTRDLKYIKKVALQLPCPCPSSNVPRLTSYVPRLRGGDPARGAEAPLTESF